MSALFLFVGLSLGSLFGFLLALLVLHGRAQSLAEEMVAGRAGEYGRDDSREHERAGAWGRVTASEAAAFRAPFAEWNYAGSHPSGTKP